MKTMNVSLPDLLKKFVDQRVSAGHYGTVSEYIRELIRRDAESKNLNTVDHLLMEGLKSPLTEMGPNDWKALEKRVLRKASNTHKR